MRRVCGALALAALLPVSARAEPISVSLGSPSGGFTQAGTSFDGYRGIDLGTITMSGAGSTGLISVEGLRTWSNYSVSFTLEGIEDATALRVEILDPFNGDDRSDPLEQPEYVPRGYTTSNNRDGLSFAQDSALERSALFAGGSASVMADENTHRGDILLFSGLQTASEALLRFGLRDSIGGRQFLVRFSLVGNDADPGSLATPEPASMLLIGTGLVGMAGAYRRNRRAARAHAA